MAKYNNQRVSELGALPELRDDTQFLVITAGGSLRVSWAQLKQAMTAEIFATANRASEITVEGGEQ